ncbi:hypothetical protein [Streptomyces youssoufiensis]
MGRHRTKTAIERATQWAARRRRAAVSLILRGACYGAGTSAVGLLAYWARGYL